VTCRRISRSHLSTIVLVVLFVLLVPATALATPISDKKERAREIRAQLAELDAKLGATVEQYNYAREKLAAVQGQIKRNTKALKVARYNLAVAHRNLNDRVVALYKERPVDVLDVMFSAGSFEELASQIDLLQRLGDHDTDIIESVEGYKREVQDKRVGLLKDRKAANKLVGEVAAKKSEIEGRLSERQGMLAGVEAEIRRMEAAEARAAAARVAAAEAAAAAATGGGGGTAATTPNQRPIIPDQGGPGHPEVCAIAARYLGIPYKYAGASPSTGFDCSGFVMYVYAQIGMSLPHYSGSQQQMGTPVSMGSLQPGDLVFRGNPAYHVGIYVGGGSVIHSPHTGAVVSYQSVSGWTSAVRL